MKFYYAPISTYSQKVLLAFYEKGIEFEKSLVNLSDPKARAQYRELYPIGKIPLLMIEDNHPIPESSIIIEYLEGHFQQGPQLIPSDIEEARKVRFFDRMNDLYLNNAMTTLFFSEGKSEEQLAQARGYLDVSYEKMNGLLENNTWFMGDDFTMADCSAIPPLLYLQKIYPYDKYPHVVAYFERAQQRESYQRVLDDAMPVLKEMGMA